jgi:hypothetical protein
MNKLEHAGVMLQIVALAASAAWLWYASRGQNSWGAMAAGPLVLLLAGAAVALAVLEALFLTGQGWALWGLRPLAWLTAVVLVHELVVAHNATIPAIAWVAIGGGALSLAGFVGSRSWFS